MAKPSLLSLGLGLLLLFHGCLALSSQSQSQSQSQQYQNECQINRLDSIEPVTRTKSEAGVTEWWNPNSQQLRCVGVSVMRHIIDPNGLVLPSFTNAPVLLYIVQGRGIQGTVMPGCPETFQDSQQQHGQSPRFRDQHQKIRRFREGDVIALPAGVVHWAYNDGNERVIAVHLIDTSNSANQLDMNPRKFHLAGNAEKEQRTLRRLQQRQQERGSRSESQYEEEEEEEEEEDNRRRHESHGHEQQESCGNVLCRFRAEDFAEALNVDVELVRKLQKDQGRKGTIVKVNKLGVIEPPSRMEHEEREEWQQERRQHGERGSHERGNGLEETFCTMRIKENIADQERADIFNPQAGRVCTLNSFKLPILRHLGLSAERGVLYNKAGLIPQWTTNAHRIFYMLRGRARFQVVNQNGESVFNDYVEQEQILTVPQNFVFLKKAGSEGAEWICFYTNDNAMNTPVAGRVSALRGIPDQVVAASFQISTEEARKVKFSNQDNFFFTSSRSDRRAEA